MRESDNLWARAKTLIPCGTQTLSKAPNQFVFGVHPKYIKRGSGSHVWDVDGNEYIDYPMALGALLLGHAYKPVVNAVKKQIEGGTVYTMMHPLEVEVAEILRDMIPCADMVRFGKNGSDATTAAVRIARAYTGREKIAYCGYHGWQDWHAATKPEYLGIPKAYSDLVYPFVYNDIKSLDRLLNENHKKFAAVIMEQGTEHPSNDFLNQVKSVAHRNGALFILDEVVTGFRFGPGGAQQYFKVIPDLACFGKAMGNGFPISAVVGKRQFMKKLKNVFFSMTFGGDTSALAAAKATLNIIRNEPVVEHVWKMGDRLADGFNDMAISFGLDMRMVGHSPRMVINFPAKTPDNSLVVKSLFLQETIKRGVLFGSSIFPSYSHNEKDIDKTLGACRGAMEAIARAMRAGNIKNALKGKPIKSIFRPMPTTGRSA